MEGRAKERPGAQSAVVVEQAEPVEEWAEDSERVVGACWHGACKRPATCEDRESKQGMISLAHSL